MEPQRSENDREQNYGEWASVCVTIFGVVLPTSVWFYLSNRYDNDVGWQMGGAFVSFIGLIGILIAAEITGVVLARRFPTSTIARRASVFANGVLLLAGLLFVYLFCFLLFRL